MADDCHLGLSIRCAFDKRRGRGFKTSRLDYSNTYPAGNESISHQTGKGKSSSSKVLAGRGCHVFPKFVYNDMIWYHMIWYDMIWYDEIYLSLIIQKHVCFVIPRRIRLEKVPPKCLLICLHKEWSEGIQATPKWCTLWPWKFSF